jgi:outer membrane protein OmpA-like peptidoglycan-associated protein
VYNAYLSYKRAKSVVDYFVNNGIPYSMLRAKGYGEEKPIDNNDTENGRQKNRRTEIKMLRLE